MALPSTGQLTFEQIGTELGISTVGPHDLRSMSSTAGKFVPDSVEEFYGYTHSSIPTAPTKCSTSMNGPLFGIQLTWFDTSDNETGFRIEWSVNAGGYGNTSTVGAGVTVEYFGTCTNGSTYQGRVQSYNGSGNSAWCYGGVATGDIDCAI